MNVILNPKISKLMIFIIFVIAGCASVDVTKTAKGFYEQTNPNEVQILKTIPNKRYIELGTVTVTGFRPTDTAKMHNAVRKKSAALGADAVVLTSEGMAYDGWSTKKWATGVAIKYEK